MGAWGIGPFENDSALDFVSEIIDGGGIKRIESAINFAVEAKGAYLEAPEAEEALAAAAILGMLKNPAARPGYVPDDLILWLAKQKQLRPSYLDLRAARSNAC